MKKPRTWKQETARKIFLAGLDRVIEFTRACGNEAGFRVRYVPEEFLFMYPLSIDIGSDRKLNHTTPVNLEEIAREYKTETGFTFAHNANPEWAKRAKELNEEESSEEFYSARKWLKQWEAKNPGKLLNIPYPPVVGYINSLSRVHNHGLDGSYYAIDVHTHPKRSMDNYVGPSKADLEALNHNHRENLFSSEITIVNPISIVVGVHRKQTEYPVFIFQEKHVLPVDTDFARLVEGMHESEGFNRFLTIKNPDAKLSDAGRLVIDSYNIVCASYSNGKFHLWYREKWDALDIISVR